MSIARVRSPLIVWRIRAVGFRLGCRGLRRMRCCRGRAARGDANGPGSRLPGDFAPGRALRAWSVARSCARSTLVAKGSPLLVACDACLAVAQGGKGRGGEEG